jgi:hypothetical protein
MDCSGGAWRSHLYMTYTPRPFIRSICNVSFVVKHFICEFGNGMLRGEAPVNLRERECVSCPNATGSQFDERQMTITWVAVISGRGQVCNTYYAWIPLLLVDFPVRCISKNSLKLYLHQKFKLSSLVFLEKDWKVYIWQHSLCIQEFWEVQNPTNL